MQRPLHVDKIAKSCDQWTFPFLLCLPKKSTQQLSKKTARDIPCHLRTPKTMSTGTRLMETLPAFRQVWRRAYGQYTGQETHADTHTGCQDSKVITKLSPIPKLNLLRVNGSSANLLITLTMPGDCNIKIISWPTHQCEVPRRCHFVFQCPLPQPEKTYCYIN